MKKIITLISLVLGFNLSFSQIPMNEIPEVPKGTCIPNVNATNKSGNPTPDDGSGTLGLTYSLTKCGLGYVTSTQKLGQRFSPPGIPQPATFPVSGMPVCAIIEKAYLYMDCSGGGVSVTASITNPISNNASFLMTQIGGCQDKCWGYTGTFSYRGDVTSIIAGNGNYVISGLPVGSPDDTDGATLIIIYSDPSVTFQGDIVLWDGCDVGIGTLNTETMSGLSICATPSTARAFMIVADFQNIGGMVSLNGSPYFGIPDDWWNYVDQTTTLTTVQTTSTFGADGASSDCFNFMLMGLYWQTTACTTCIPSSGVLPVTATNGTSNCNPCTGTSTATATGGTPPYTYMWNTVPVQTTQTATGLCPGTYIVTVNDQACFVGFDTITIAAPNAVTVTATSTNVACNGQSTGTAQATPVGGTAPYTYVWNSSPPQNTQNAVGLAAGTYTVTITDANGCTSTAVVTITQPGLLIATTSQMTLINCFGGNTGSAAASPGGGTPPYTYSWSTVPVQNTATATGLTAGTYTVTVTDANNCTVTSTITITQPNQLLSPVTSTPDTCSQGTGAAGTLVTGGTGPYAYVWSPSGGNNAIASGLTPGIYTVTVTDANGCTSTGTTTVGALGSPTAAFTVSPNVGPSNTLFTVTDASSGGSGTIVNWNWNYAGQGTATGQNPPPYPFSGSGTYCITLTVTSNLGCTDSTQLCIEVIDSVSVPNIITPNGDNMNDFLFFKNLDQYPGSRLVIYNRWGNLLYEDANYLNNWNAMNVSDGTYYFVLYVADKDKNVKAGWVAVMRKK